MSELTELASSTPPYKKPGFDLEKATSELHDAAANLDKWDKVVSTLLDEKAAKEK